MAMKCCTKLETAKERCPIVFQGDPSNFKVTVSVQNITDFDPNWAFPNYRPVAAFKSLRFALFIFHQINSVWLGLNNCLHSTSYCFTSRSLAWQIRWKQRESCVLKHRLMNSGETSDDQTFIINTFHLQFVSWMALYLYNLEYHHPKVLFQICTSMG